MGDLVPFRRRKPKQPRWTRPEDYGAKPSPDARTTRWRTVWRRWWPPLLLLALVTAFVLVKNTLNPPPHSAQAASIPSPSRSSR